MSSVLIHVLHSWDLRMVFLDLTPDFSLHVRVTAKGRHTSFLQEHACLLCIFSGTVTVMRKTAIAPHPALREPKSAYSAWE